MRAQVFSSKDEIHEALMSVYRANLSEADLSGSDLSEADLHRANLYRADLSEADLSGADLREADLSGSDLSGSDMSGADLSEANLRGSDLSGADLSGAYLMQCVGNMREIKSMQLETYAITYTSNVLQIGCEQHSIQKWLLFTDDEIKAMDNEALDFWKKYKDHIFTTIELSPAITAE